MAGEGELRRAELGRFLRARREAISPLDRGLSTSPRRRARGLLREEVAGLAEVSTTWYTYLEQGRDIHPSSAVLDRLMTVLRLDDDERRYVEVLATGQTSPTRPIGQDLTADVVELLGAAPHPLYAGNQYGDLLSWNAAAVEWYTDWALLPDGRRNMLWWLLCDPAARDRLPDWEADARDVVARLRTNLGSLSGEPRMQAVLADLSGHSRLFVRWWGEQTVVEQRTRLRRLCHPVLGERSYQLMALRPADNPFVSYLVHVPVSPTKQ